MLIAVLLLALLGLWTPCALALVIAYQVGAPKQPEAVGAAVLKSVDVARGGRQTVQKRLQCSTCGAHTFTTVPVQGKPGSD